MSLLPVMLQSAWGFCFVFVVSQGCPAATILLLFIEALGLLKLILQCFCLFLICNHGILIFVVLLMVVSYTACSSTKSGVIVIYDLHCTRPLRLGLLLLLFLTRVRCTGPSCVLFQVILQCSILLLWFFLFILA